MGFLNDCTAGARGDAAAPGYSLDVVQSGEELVWSTSPLTGPWLDFPGQRTYVIDLPAGLLGHPPTSIVAWVSSDNPSNAGVPHMNYTQASGLLAEFPNCSVQPPSGDLCGHMQLINASTQLGILNASCADYSLRVEVRAQLNSGGAAARGDSGQDAADAGATDGSQGDTANE
jgi:hypothetical protein